MYFIDMSTTTVLQKRFSLFKKIHLISKKILCSPHYLVLASDIVQISL